MGGPASQQVPVFLYIKQPIRDVRVQARQNELYTHITTCFNTVQASSQHFMYMWSVKETGFCTF